MSVFAITRRSALLLVWAAACTRPHRAEEPTRAPPPATQSPSPVRCTSPGRSAIAWQDPPPTPSGEEAQPSRVVALESGAPLDLVRISLSPGEFRTHSDATGAFRLPAVPPGAYTLTATRIGRVRAEAQIYLTGRRPRQILVVLAIPDWGLREC